MEEQIEVLALVDQHEDGDLWYATNDPTTPQKVFDFLRNNSSDDEPITVKLTNVSKADYEAED